MITMFVFVPAYINLEKELIRGKDM